MKTAIIHDWILDRGGSEACLEQIYALYPSDVLTLLAREESIRALGIDPSRVRTSFLQACPGATRRHRWYLPFFPLAVEQFDLSAYDVVISSSHAVAKGAMTTARQLHICYCHTPMRYVWDLSELYLRQAGLDTGLRRYFATLVLNYLRNWDALSAKRVDRFVANSRHVAKRIKKIYGRESTVIYPPVDIDRFGIAARKEDYYVAAARLVSYKRMDLIVEAFSAMPRRKLVVIGDGPDLKKIAANATGNIELLGRVPFEVLRDHLQRARAFIFAAEEDFGILPVEAQACGTPVIAYGAGGVLETVVPFGERGEHGPVGDEHATGVFFHEQTAQAVASGVALFEQHEREFDGHAIRRHSQHFSRERFREEFRLYVDNAVAEHFRDP